MGAVSHGLAAGVHRLLWLLIWVVPGPRWAKLIALAVLVVAPAVWRRGRAGRGGWQGRPPAGV